MNENQSLVSVCMITYNHEAYIAQAIEGVLMQNTSFLIELVIGEDCSTDNSRNICKEYQEKFPNIIKLLLPDKNLGAISNFIATIQSCTGKYIALCEGDDYWTDPYKLQKQVDFLEAHEEYSASSHNVLMINEINGVEKVWHSEIYDRDITKEETTEKGNRIVTLSLVFRNDKEVIDKVNFFAKKGFPLGDYLLNLTLTEKGNIKYFSSIMGVYRVHEGGWSSQFYDLNKSIKNYQKYISYLDEFPEYFNFKDNFTIHKTKMYDRLRIYLALNGDKKEVRKANLFLVKNLTKYQGDKFRLICSIVFSELWFSAYKKRTIAKEAKSKVLSPNGG